LGCGIGFCPVFVVKVLTDLVADDGTRKNTDSRRGCFAFALTYLAPAQTANDGTDTCTNSLFVEISAARK